MAEIKRKTINKNLKNAIRTVALLIAVLRFTACYTQSPASYNLAELYDFNVKTIYGLHQARDKHMWIATDQGLFEFDGTVFHKYINNEHQSEYSLIKEDREGRIWCRNFSGQIFYVENKSLMLFKNVNEYTINGLPEFTIARFPQIYIGTDYGYIVADFYNRDNTKHFQTKAHDKSDYKILQNKDTVYRDIVDLIQSYKNELIYYNTGFSVNILQKDRIQSLFTAEKWGAWVAMFSNGDQVFFSAENDDRKLRIFIYQNGTTQLKEYEELPPPTRTAIYYDASIQKYWLGTSDGAFLLDKTLRVTLSYPFLKGNAVSGIVKDHEGNYWIGTLHNGIYVIPSLKIRTLDSSNSILIKNEIIGLEKVHEDRLIFSDNLGNVYQYHTLNNKISLLFSIGIDVGSIVYNPIKNVIHFSNIYKVYNTKTKKLIPTEIDHIKAGTAIDSVNFLISTTGGSYITNFNTTTNQLPMDTLWQHHYALYSTIEHPAKRLLLRKKRTTLNTLCNATRTIYISYSDGLFSYKNAKERKILYHNKPLIVTTLHPDIKQGVWVANTEGVLFHVFENKVNPIDTFDIEIRHIGQKDSLLFLGTNKGLIKYNIKRKLATVINTLDGLPSNTVTGLAIVNDTVFTATLKGLSKVPVSYNDKNRVAPEVTLTKMLVNGETRDLEKSFRQGPRENNLAFFFNTYALRSQKTFTYAYRMLGIDSTWNQTRTNSVSFAALAPNQYTFQIKAINEDGVESHQIQQIRFTIDKPFHQKWWFYVLISVSSIALVSYMFRYRIATIKKQNNLQQQKKDMERKLTASAITTLKAQMNPHFMFNAMTSIQSLILEDEKDEAYTYLTKFSSLIRENLNMSEKNFVYFSRERELINTYLQLEKLRFGSDFEYIIESKTPIDDLKIPTMIIQPFVENAIKHGLLHKSGTRRLRITFHKGKVLHCTIIDNGVGRKASGAINSKRKNRHESFSTGAIEKRFTLLREYYNLDLGFTYTDLEENNMPTGTQVLIKIPYFKDDD